VNPLVNKGKRKGRGSYTRVRIPRPGRFTYASLRDPNYSTLKLRLEAAHSAVEAATVEARRRGCG
jgi:hypothetical protein